MVPQRLTRDQPDRQARSRYVSPVPGGRLTRERRLPDGAWLLTAVPSGLGVPTRPEVRLASFGCGRLPARLLRCCIEVEVIAIRAHEHVAETPDSLPPDVADEAVLVKRRTTVIGLGIGLVLVGLVLIFNFGLASLAHSPAFREHNSTHPFTIEVSSRAVVTDDVELLRWNTMPDFVSPPDDVRVEGVAAGSGSLFMGIAPADAVAGYLDGVAPTRSPSGTPRRTTSSTSSTPETRAPPILPLRGPRVRVDRRGAPLRPVRSFPALHQWLRDAGRPHYRQPGRGAC